MTGTELLANLKAKDIRLSAHGDSLKVDAPKGALTMEMVAMIKTHKAVLLVATKSNAVADGYQGEQDKPTSPTIPTQTLAAMRTTASFLAFSPRASTATSVENAAILIPTPKPPSPTMPEAWFIPGQRAPGRDSFPTEADGSHLTDRVRGPDWIDYLYELHNHGLILANGWIMREAATGRKAMP